MHTCNKGTLNVKHKCNKGMSHLNNIWMQPFNIDAQYKKLKYILYFLPHLNYFLQAVYSILWSCCLRVHWMRVPTIQVKVNISSNVGTLRLWAGQRQVIIESIFPFDNGYFLSFSFQMKSILCKWIKLGIICQISNESYEISNADKHEYVHILYI